jgi:hypothetical protein
MIRSFSIQFVIEIYRGNGGEDIRDLPQEFHPIDLKWSSISDYINLKPCCQENLSLPG